MSEQQDDSVIEQPWLENLNSHLAPGNIDVKTITTCERNQSLNIE